MKEIKKCVLKSTKKMMDVILKVEANTTSCALVYQPKAPKQLSRFRHSDD